MCLSFVARDTVAIGIVCIGWVPNRIRNARAIEHDRIPRLLKEERRIALVGFLHFPDMIEIVAADAIDTANGKRAAARDRGFGRSHLRQRLLRLRTHFFCP